ncbi:MAG: AI-2E family transporter [Pseudolabrys sp.]|nr:AI-2E family transporter [Pseudolabrys sp.]
MSMGTHQRESGVLAFMLVAISVAFGWIMWPFAGAILWGVLLSIIFAPLYRLLLTWMPRWPNAASAATVLLIALLVVLPMTLVAAVLVQEVSGLVGRLQSGELDVRQPLADVRTSLPEWAANLLTQFETTGIAALRDKFSTAFMEGGKLVARQILSFGQVTVEFLLGVFVMLYLLFYLLRDGNALLTYSQRAIPLPPEQRQVLASSFTDTVRGVLKGDLVVGLVQGSLGGLIFWVLGLGTPVLWGAVMAVLSLLPAFGTGLVWAPAGIYLLLTGSVWKGLILLAFGTLVISTIDNVLRPALVGKDVKMPSYVVLVSTLGGLAVFGVNGFVIGPLLAALFLTAWEMYLQTGGGQQDGASP